MAVSGIHYGRVGGSVVQQGWAVADIVTTVEVGGLLRALGEIQIPNLDRRGSPM